jgi:hypothetical protein
MPEKASPSSATAEPERTELRRSVIASADRSPIAVIIEAFDTTTDDIARCRADLYIENILASAVTRSAWLPSSIFIVPIAHRRHPRRARKLQRIASAQAAHCRRPTYRSVHGDRSPSKLSSRRRGASREMRNAGSSCSAMML